VWYFLFFISLYRICRFDWWKEPWYMHKTRYFPWNTHKCTPRHGLKVKSKVHTTVRIWCFLRVNVWHACRSDETTMSSFYQSLIRRKVCKYKISNQKSKDRQCNGRQKKGQTMIYKTMHRRLKIELYE
jgi:hypothetical protein